MIQHLKLFLRNLRRHKAFSFINILGLSLGAAGSILIYLYVTNELNYDRFHENADRIYRVNQTFIWGDDNNQYFSSTGPGVAYALLEELPELDEVTRVHTHNAFLVTYKDIRRNAIISFEEQNILAVDSNFLEVFTFPLIAGAKDQVLNRPHSVVMTKSSAERYFGSDVETAVGRLVTLGQSGISQTYELTGILQDLPGNSFIDFDMLLSMNSFPRVEEVSWSWIWTTFVTFALVNENADLAIIENKLKVIPPKYAAATLENVMATSWDEYIKSGKEWNLAFQPFTSVHLDSGGVYPRLNEVGNRNVVNALAFSALFILLLSCINYMNIKTSQIARNARETGVRKLMGSSRLAIGVRYFIESFLFVLVSVGIGFLVAFYALPYFDKISGVRFDMSLLFEPQIFFYLLILTLAMGLVGGLYPALVLSTFNPIEVMKGKLSSGRTSGRFRNISVVIQFSLSLVLLASTVIVYSQLQHTLQRDIGFQKENLIAVNRVEWVKGQESLAQELNNIPGVVSTSLCTSLPPTVFNGDQFISEENQDRTIPLNYTKADHNYIKTLGLTLRYGRNFSNTKDQNLEKVIINETAVQVLGWEVNEDVIGKKIVYPSNRVAFEIIGIVKDFHYWSPQQRIEPLAIFHYNSEIFGNNSRFIAVRLSNGNFDVVLDQIRGLWPQYSNDVSFDYSVVQESIATGIDNEKRFAETLTLFASLALIIAGLGLLGMTIYIIEQRLREIGIRMVLGSSSSQIVILLSRHFLVLVLLSLVLSVPVTWWAMGQWLQDFEYRISITAMPFVFAGSITILSVLMIVGFHSLRATKVNTASILRNE